MSAPMRRLATPVIWMTPLFCAYVVLGSAPKSADTKQVRPSARTPPRMRFQCSGLVVSRPESCAVM